MFNISEPLARGYKTHEFHNTSYGMKINLRFFLSHEITRNKQINTWNKRFLQIGTYYAVTWLWLFHALRTRLRGTAQHERRRAHFTVVDNHIEQIENVTIESRKQSSRLFSARIFTNAY